MVKYKIGTVYYVDDGKGEHYYRGPQEELEVRPAAVICVCSVPARLSCGADSSCSSCKRSLTVRACRLQAVFGVGDRVKLIGARAAAQAAAGGSTAAIVVVTSTYPLTADAQQRGIIISPLGGGLGSMVVAAADIAFANPSDDASGAFCP